MMLGGGVIAGELWWPGQKLISIPSTEEVVKYTATTRYSHGWVDARGGFGSAPVKPEGGRVLYDPAGQEISFSEDSLEQLVIDIRRGGGPEAMSIVPRTIMAKETFGKTEAKRRARMLGADQAHGIRLKERIIRV